MKKTRTLLIFAAIVVAISVVISQYVLTTVETKISKEPVVIEGTIDVTSGETTLEIMEIEAEETIEEMYPLDMTEAAVQNVLHGMVHQKVEAKEKWSFTPMTQPRIERMIEVVEASDHQNGELYLEILNRWVVGDFSRAVYDHNAIWKLQGGTIGKATGLLSPDEEKQFIQQYYDVELIGKEMESAQ